LDSLPDTGDNCLRRRVEAWCHGDVEGRYAYALDNPKNNFDWETFWRVGFDVSEFLVAGHPATEPILSYLFHLKTLMQRDGGGLLATVVEEFWLPIMYPTTAAQILDTLKTGRRRDEFILLVTQSPEDAIKSPLLSAILQQTPTKIFLANPDAEYTNKEGGGYIRFGLTPKEFSKLQQLGLQDRKFLVKQGSQSSIAMLDLGGLGDDIAILAGAADDFPHLVAAQNEVGKNPDDWIPVYLRKRKEGKQKPKT
jgi:type IV secretion system protein VirB4